MGRPFYLDDPLHNYILEHSTPPSPVEQRLIDATAAMGGISMIQISPDQGLFLRTLVHLTAPSLVVEVGTFTGYSALMMAQALPPGGRIIACDVSEEWTGLAKPFWEEAGVDDRIDLRIAPAIETLRSLPDEPVDLAFIDADKGSYVDYYEELIGRLSSRGVIAVDNTLWSGAVADPDDTSDNTVALRAFNDHVIADHRVDVVQLSLGDGLTLIRHRGEG